MAAISQQAYTLPTPIPLANVPVLDNTKLPAAIDLSKLKGVGINATWQNAGRFMDTNYQNTSGFPIAVSYSVSYTGALSPPPNLTANIGVDTASFVAIQTVRVTQVAGETNTLNLFFIVPSGYWFKITGNTLGTPVAWMELK